MSPFRRRWAVPSVARFSHCPPARSSARPPPARSRLRLLSWPPPSGPTSPSRSPLRVRPHRRHCPQVPAIRSRRGIGAGLAGLVRFRRVGWRDFSVRATQRGCFRRGKPVPAAIAPSLPPSCLQCGQSHAAGIIGVPPFPCGFPHAARLSISAFRPTGVPRLVSSSAEDGRAQPRWLERKR